MYRNYLWKTRERIDRDATAVALTIRPFHLALAASLAASAWAAAGTASPNPAAAPTSAVATLGARMGELAEAKRRDDWAAYLVAARRLGDFVNWSPTAHLEVARALLRLRRPAEAAAEVDAFLAAGQTNPILSTALFEPVAKSRADAIAANALEVGRPALVTGLPPATDLPEDVDWDAGAGRFLVTTVRGRAIRSVGRDGRASPFAASPSGWPMVALKVDAARRRVWATEVAFQGFSSVPKGDWGRSAVLEYDLGDGRLLSRVEGPPGASLGDLALDRDGAPVVADGEGGGLYRLAGGRLARLDRGDFVSPQTVASCGDPSVLYVPDYVRGLARMDLRSGRVEWLRPGRDFALNGIDGLYCRDGVLVAIQNGASPGRVVALELARGGRAVRSARVLDRRPGGDFTHGVLVGPDLVYLARAGWDATDEKGEPTGGGAAPPAMMRVRWRPDRRL